MMETRLAKSYAVERAIDFNLVAKSYATDSMGQRTATETVRKVLGSLSSVGMTEYAAAGQAGLAPAYRVLMQSVDYHGEDAAELGDQTLAERFTGNGSTASYEMARSVYQVKSVTVDGDDAAYTRTGNTVTLADMPDDGASISVAYVAYTRYGIYRTYLRNDDRIELYLQRKAGVTDE